VTLAFSPAVTGEIITMPKKNARQQAIEIRRGEVTKLRTKGNRTYREIAEKLNVSVGTVVGDMWHVLDNVRSQQEIDVEKCRDVELAQLDFFMTKVLAIVTDETDRDLVLKAIDRGVKLSERRSRLLGLDAPERQEVATVDLTEATPERARAIMNELFPAIGNDTNTEGQREQSREPGLLVTTGESVP